jgi:hypothetical protein
MQLFTVPSFGLLARRGDFVRGLVEGDPTAWGFLVVAIVLMVGWAFVKRMWR